MKKTLLILSLLVGSTFAVNAQCVPDETRTEFGASPTTLPTACENTSYDETITVTIKKGIETPFGTFDIDSAFVTKVTNLHNGFTYQCNTDKCFIELNETDFAHGCLSISGTPTEIGIKTIKVEYNAYSNGQVITNSYNVDVTVKAANDSECSPTSIFDVQNKSNTLGVYPNPSNGQELNFNSTLHNVSVIDQLGNVVYTADEAKSIQLETATKGIYFLKADEGIEKIIIK